jgi:hypothetical protein
MVTSAARNALIAALESADAAEPLIERLDPPRRAAVLMAILGLVLVGLLIVTCVMIAGRWTRRIARQRHGPTRNTGHVENRRLREALAPMLADDEDGTSKSAGETAVVRRRSDETVADG